MLKTIDPVSDFNFFILSFSKISSTILALDLQLAAVDHHQCAHSVMLDWGHRDPADRLIVSLAQINDATIISDDVFIREFYPRTV